MERTLVKGNKELAERLGVHPQTIQKWRKRGVLTKATVSDFGRTIFYDLDKVFECLNFKPVTVGRKRI